MSDRSFYHLTLSPDQALRLALSHMATASGKDYRLLAAALDLSPSQFSRAITTTPSEESHQRANFPAEKIATYSQESASEAYLRTLLDYLGYDPSRLHTIRRETKSQAQAIADLAEKIEATKTVLKEAGEQLKLMMPLDAGVKRRGR